VYGLGADAGNADAVRRIFAAKGRPADHPVIVHIPGVAHVAHWRAPFREMRENLPTHSGPAR
jgi:L-threonylcarbamoyladenylate synthase